MVDLEWSWMEKCYKPWSPETEPKTGGATRRNQATKMAYVLPRLPAVRLVKTGPSKNMSQNGFIFPQGSGVKNKQTYI